jgi:hypothetical protein
MTRQTLPTGPAASGGRLGDERGSALILAIFVLVILTSMGVALLFLSESEVKMTQSDIRSKQAFYIAEAALEDGRTALFHTNGREEFDDDLLLASGGSTGDGAFSADPDTLRPVYDSNDRVTGFTGYGDDNPLVTTLLPDGGGFAAFLSNDSADVANPLLDSNKRVLLTGVGAGQDRSFEIVQAIVEFREIFPSFPPATITILGPNPVFSGGNSDDKLYVGDDCNGSGGIPGYHVPVVGTVGSEITSGMPKPHTFSTDEGAYTGYDSVADISDSASIADTGSAVGTIDPSMLDCLALKEIVEAVRDYADVVCTPPTPCVWPPNAPGRVVMVDGDLVLGPTDDGEGMLLVTGSLEFHGNTDWVGLVMVVGEGQFLRAGGGDGTTLGSLMIADIAGPDNTYGTVDDCTGGVGGYDSATFDESGGGEGDTIYCTDALVLARPLVPYDILEFVQR